MPNSTREPADRIILRFIRSREDLKWSAGNIASATFHLNRAHAWLTCRDLSLTHPDIEELVEALQAYIRERGRQVKANSVIVEHRQLRAFYKWAIMPGPTGKKIVDADDNPMNWVLRPEEEDADPADRPVAAEWQYDALIATCRTRKNAPRRRGAPPANHERDAAIIALLWHTGMRRSEIANIDYERIDWATDRVFLERTKGGRRGPKSRWVPIPEEAMRYVDAWIDERGQADGPLFPSSSHDHRLAPNSITLMLRTRAKRAAATLGLTPAEVYTPAHSFRRASAIDWLANGGDVLALKRNHGWSGDKMVDTYTSPHKDELTDAEARRVAKARAANRRLRAI